MIFTRRFGALAARPQFPDAPELQEELNTPVDLDAELARLTAGDVRLTSGDDDRRRADESAA
ncbi:hypothetical protein ACWCOV_00065 [Kribbella sp. NPDC002412]